MTPATDLQKSLDNAALLLDSAAERGLNLTDDIVKPIVQFDKAAATPEAEAKFWQAFAALAKLMAPVTIESLNAAKEPDQQTGSWFHTSRASAAGRAIRSYRRLAWIALFCLSTAQIYSLVGSTVVANIDKLPKDIEDINDKILKRTAQLAQTQVAATSAATSAGQMAWPAALTGSSLADDPEIAKLEAERDELDAQLSMSVDVLASWNLGWRSLWERSVMIAGGGSAVTASERRDNSPRRTAQQMLIDKVHAKTTAQFVLAAMQLYILPFLYGLLGTCVYIVRNLAAEIRALSFSSDAGYRLRLPLGALAGVAIAWFINPQTNSVMGGSLSPLALAFLAGYSVEVLFTAMDRFISAFSSSGGPGAQQSAT